MNRDVDAVAGHDLGVGKVGEMMQEGDVGKDHDVRTLKAAAFVHSGTRHRSAVSSQAAGRPIMRDKADPGGASETAGLPDGRDRSDREASRDYGLRAGLAEEDGHDVRSAKTGQQEPGEGDRFDRRQQHDGVADERKQPAP